MPDDPGSLVSLLTDGGTFVAVVVVSWFFWKFVNRTQDASDRREEKVTTALDALKGEMGEMRTAVAKLADAVDDFRGGRRNVEGG